MIDPGTSIRRAAVLGAGVMGAQVAAHLANAGVPVDLYELGGEGSDPRAPARQALERLHKLRPAPLARPDVTRGIWPACYELDLERLAQADLVIEAVAERMDVKRNLYQRVAPALGETTVFASNTSGLPVAELAQALPRAMRPRFCGVHFFNPPRYMHLVELIDHPQTDRQVLHRLEGFLTTTLGKGVLHARDTPGFIGNRIGVFAICAVMRHAERLGLPFDLVDQLTGPGVGRPKSATFRTADVVGLDTFSHVVNHLHDTLADDPWRDCFRIPDWMQTLLDAGSFGHKSGAGIYRKARGGIEVLDPASGEYRPVDAQLRDDVATALKERDVATKYARLAEIDHPQAELVRASQRDLFHYCAHHLAQVAPSAREIDFALRWGFGWELGAFETWQLLGWREVAERLEQAIAAGETLAPTPLPDWVRERRREGVHGPRGSWAADTASWLPRSNHPVYRRQRFPVRLVGEPRPRTTTLWENAGVRLWDSGDDVAVLGFLTPMHAVGDAVLDGILEAIGIAERESRALVIWQDRPPFCVGADLKAVRRAQEAGDYAAIESLVARFQQATWGLRHAQIPTVAAPSGLALGGGLEIMLHCDVRVAALETYCGLVEAGVGLIPAGGGCNLLARRAAEWAPDGDPWPWIQHFFEEVAYARVAGSASDARTRFWLQGGDRVVMNEDELLQAARSSALALADTGYRPRMAGQHFRVAGEPGIATLEGKLVNLHAGGFISDHDYAIGRHLAVALCGGRIEAGSEVDDAWMLRLEREGFMALARTEATAARVAHMLETGKPLRN